MSVRTSTRAILAGIVLVAASGCNADDPVQEKATCNGAAMAVATTADAATQAAASAAGTSDLLLTPPHVKVGDTLFAAGIRFFDACPSAGEAGRARTDIRLFVVQGSEEVSVAKVSAAGPDGTFSTSFGVPPTVGPGLAAIVARLPTGDDPTAPSAATFQVDPA